MFSRIKEFFEGSASLEVDKSGQATDKDLQIATAVLLLGSAGADDDYAPEEIKACFRSLEQHFKIDDSETLAIFEMAEKLRNESDQIETFVKSINENFSDKQKQLILAMIWKIIIADEVIENYEQKYASKVRQLLQLSREQAEQAKELALGGEV